MFKKIIYFSLAIVMLSACGTSTKTTKTVKKTVPPPVPPEGITFTGVKNYKSFAFINHPYGSGFTQNQDVDVDSHVNDADEFVPGVKYKGNHVYIWSKLRDTDGDLDVQYEALKKKMLNSLIKENSIVDFEKKKIGNRDVALIRIVTPISGGGIEYSYGYLIAHNSHSASCFVLCEALMWKADDEKVQAYEAPLDKAFIYMIKTVEFR